MDWLVAFMGLWGFFNGYIFAAARWRKKYDELHEKSNKQWLDLWVHHMNTFSERRNLSSKPLRDAIDKSNQAAKKLANGDVIVPEPVYEPGRVYFETSGENSGKK